ncbi:type II secretion system protein [Catenovulum adriaticum]|uniref:Type II secretion system GspH family protein n=1 Tax=Catenovulum adriaticum TaxID=2984846 RepID=A0ABY7AKK0_9ALTE|nr:prepilin-type N-terminal cleavage/methylation domain-containing protein [Catenovulum sp. TS8]WAJ70063.1 type II secretion system GspH family protein [Catenovulum sp. TS8]
MRSNKGFTLIELIVVIVVLGILAVTAAPKFIGVQDEANGAVADGIVGSITSAMSMTHGKALVSSSTAADDDVSDSNLGTIEMVFGYPEASSLGIGKIIDLPQGWTPGNASAATSTYTLKKDDCTITYTEAADASSTATVAKVCS